MKCSLFFLLVIFLANLSLVAQNLDRYNLAQVLQWSLSRGYEGRIIQENMDATQAQFAQTQAGSSGSKGTALRLLANASYNAALNQGDNIFLSGQTSSTTVTTLPQTITGGLTLSGPSTDLSLTESHTLNAKSQGDWGNSGSVGLTLSQFVWDGYLGEQ